jgi:glucokinase
MVSQPDAERDAAKRRIRAVLAGDVGGTNTRLAIFPLGNPAEPLLQRIYPSAAFSSLEAVVREFVAEAGQALPALDIQCAGFGVAGPADGATVKFTNLPWIVRTDALAQAFGLRRVVFVNDFAAICRAVPHLGSADVLKLGGGDPKPAAPITVLGAGTGLGVGFLVPGSAGYRTVASEGGHVDFAPRDEQQLRLVRFLQTRRDGSYIENVLSGRGLINLYEFLRDAEGLPESRAVREAMAGGDPAAVISAQGLNHADPLCQRTLHLFCSIYGAVAAGLALLVMARGGVYVAGGIARHIQPALTDGPFRTAFEHHIRYSEFLRSIPRFLILHPQPGLLGAALAAQEGGQVDGARH